MSDPQLDAELRAYLEEQKRAKSEGNTIHSLRLEVHEATRLVRSAMAMVQGMNARVANLEVDSQSIHADLEDHGAKLVHHAAEIVAIKRRVRRGADDEEMATGRFDVAEIRRALDEQQKKRAESERAKADEIIWWKRTIVLWIAAIFGFIATTTLTILITMAIAGKK